MSVLSDADIEQMITTNLLLCYGRLHDYINNAIQSEPMSVLDPTQLKQMSSDIVLAERVVKEYKRERTKKQ